MKLAGIDFGEKRVGLALSDDSGALAFPKGILANDSEIIEKLLKIITEKKVEKIIFGLSQNAQGEDNPVMKKGREFAGELQKISGVSVIFQNESFSSVHARMDNEKDIDASAAALILQRYIDSQKHD